MHRMDDVEFSRSVRCGCGGWGPVSDVDGAVAGGEEERGWLGGRGGVWEGELIGLDGLGEGGKGGWGGVGEGDGDGD